MGKGFDIGNLIRQAQELKDKFTNAQDELAGRTVEASAGGGMVTAVVNGRLELVSIRIEPSLVASPDLEMLQDLVVAAVNEGVRAARRSLRSTVCGLRDTACSLLPAINSLNFNHGLVFAAAFGTAPGCLDMVVRRHRSNRLADLAAQAIDEQQTEPDRAVRLDAAYPIRSLHVDGREMDSAPLRVFDERRRVIETHGLVVEQRRIKRRGIMRLQIPAGIREQREAGRVRFGKPVQGK